MKHLSVKKAKEFKNNTVTSREYVFEQASLNLAPISIDGRYPEAGYTSNTAVDSVVYVVSGEGLIELKDSGSVVLSPGDQIHLAKGNAYFFKGSLEIIYAATPPWTPEQTASVE